MTKENQKVDRPAKRRRRSAAAVKATKDVEDEVKRLRASLAELQADQLVK